MKRKRDSVFEPAMEREEVMALLQRDRWVYSRFLGLTRDMQEELVGFCMGNRGLKITYDPFFKAVFNPELNSTRLSRLLSSLLGEAVIVESVLQNESTRLSAGSSLLIMDIVVRLENGCLANLEMQKIGYNFPGERSACYSSDLLLRQYARIRSERKRSFTYHDISKVYTVVLMENSSREFHESGKGYRHYYRQESATGPDLELLQEYVFVTLDIYLDNYHAKLHNKDIELSELEAWLLFLSSDHPADIYRLTRQFPWFKEIYEDINSFRWKPEELVDMYSKVLEILDRNTVQYMIDEQRQEIERQRQLLLQRDYTVHQKDQEIERLKAELRQYQE